MVCQREMLTGEEHTPGVQGVR